MKGNFSKFVNELPEDTQTVIIDNIGSYTAKLTHHTNSETVLTS